MKIRRSLVEPVLVTTLLFLQTLLLPIALIYKIELFGMSFSPTYLFLIAIVFISILSITKSCKILFRKFFFLNIIIAAVFLFVMGISNGVSVQQWFSMVLLGCSICIGFLYSRYFQECFPKIIIILAFLVGIIGIILYYARIPLIDFDYAGGSMMFSVTTRRGTFFRATSLLMNPNSLGYFLVYAIALTPLKSRKKGYIRILGKSIFFGICIFCLALTGSRSATAMFALVFCIRVFSIFSNKKLLATFILFVIVSILSCYVFLLALPSQMKNLDVRIERWQVALKLLNLNETNIIFGVPAKAGFQWDGILFSDSMPLLLLLNFGIVGCVMIVVLMLDGVVKSVKLSFYKYANLPGTRNHAVFVISAIVPILLSNFFLFYPIAILFGVSLGVVFSVSYLTPKHQVERQAAN